MSLDRKRECVAILRGFIANIADREFGARLAEGRNEIALLLEEDMEIFSPQERYEIYGFMEGIFPKQFNRILDARIGIERDPKCLEVLKAIADIHSTA